MLTMMKEFQGVLNESPFISIGVYSFWWF